MGYEPQNEKLAQVIVNRGNEPKLIAANIEYDDFSATGDFHLVG